MKKINLNSIFFYIFIGIIISHSDINADCDSCRMNCANTVRGWLPYGNMCQYCNTCVQQTCSTCSWCGGLDNSPVNTEASCYPVNSTYNCNSNGFINQLPYVGVSGGGGGGGYYNPQLGGQPVCSRGSCKEESLFSLCGGLC